MANLNIREAAVALLNANGLANERLNYVQHLLDKDRLKDLSLEQRDDLTAAMQSLEQYSNNSKALWRFLTRLKRYWTICIEPASFLSR